MKFTENQKVIVRALLSQARVEGILSYWDYKHDRHLVLDEITDLSKKLKMTIKKEQLKSWREWADKGK